MKKVPNNLSKLLIGITVVGVVATLSGCEKAPMGSLRSDNPDVTIDKMFTHNNCSVYRFYDNGHAVYFSDCSLNFQNRVTCGKGCIRSQNTLGLQRNKASEIDTDIFQ